MLEGTVFLYNMLKIQIFFQCWRWIIILFIPVSASSNSKCSVVTLSFKRKQFLSKNCDLQSSRLLPRKQRERWACVIVTVLINNLSPVRADNRGFTEVISSLCCDTCKGAWRTYLKFSLWLLQSVSEVCFCWPLSTHDVMSDDTCPNGASATVKCSKSKASFPFVPLFRWTDLEKTTGVHNDTLHCLENRIHWFSDVEGF